MNWINKPEQGIEPNFICWFFDCFDKLCGVKVCNDKCTNYNCIIFFG